jgi:hypothetical protein
MGMKPGESFKVVATAVGKMWKELTDEQRTPYRKLAEKDILRFRREKDAANAEEFDE